MLRPISLVFGLLHGAIRTSAFVQNDERPGSMGSYPRAYRPRHVSTKSMLQNRNKTYLSMVLLVSFRKQKFLIVLSDSFFTEQAALEPIIT